MNPDEIRDFIAWVKRALKPGGKIYVVTVSPFSKTYLSMRDQYLDKLSQGKLFPGHFQNAMQYVDPEIIKKYPQFRIPDELVLFSRSDLECLFAREGMEICQSYSLDIPKNGTKLWSLVPDEESNLAGIVAAKKQ